MQQRGGFPFHEARDGRVLIACPVCGEHNGLIQAAMVQKHRTLTTTDQDKMMVLETEGEEWMEGRKDIVMLNMMFLCAEGHSTTIAFRGRTGQVEILTLYRPEADEP